MRVILKVWSSNPDYSGGARLRSSRHHRGTGEAHTAADELGGASYVLLGSTNFHNLPSS